MTQIQEHILLAPFSSYRIGGTARYFAEANTVSDLRSVLSEWQVKHKGHNPGPGEVFILGGGTNLLFSDNGFEGLVLKPNLQFLEKEGTRVRMGAGVLMSDLLDFAVKQGLSGLEWAGGLPGTVGGAIRGNAGAFGGEIKDTVASVESFNRISFQTATRDNTACRFGYRTSMFKEKNGEEIIMSAALSLKKGDPKKIKAAINEKIAYRHARHPMEYPNIGSIFKNVDARMVPEEALGRVKNVIKTDPFPVVPTAYLISEAGLKGVSYGGAMISPKHPNFIVNVLHATSSDVRALIQLAKEEVARTFNIPLEEEVQIFL